MVTIRKVVSLLTLTLAVNIVLGLSVAVPETQRKGAPIGTMASGKIDIWQSTGSSEYGTSTIYDVTLTVLEVVRGDDAWLLIQKADKVNTPPDQGLEYLLARVRITFNTMGNASRPVTLKSEIFKVYDKSDHPYAFPMVVSPSPALIGQKLNAGDTHEGWIPFLVSKEHKRPFMFFTGGLWFQLF